LTLRGFLGFGGNGGYFWTVTLLPLNDAVVLTFLAPAWVAILSPLLLRERPGKFTWFAIPVRRPSLCSAGQPSSAGTACSKQLVLDAQPTTESSHPNW
jgi:EamA-like transporter family